MLREGLAKMAVDVGLELVTSGSIAHLDGVDVVVHIHDFNGHCDLH
jgi:hypothetical protein